MNCHEFLDVYSDYADGLLDDRRLLRRVDAHRAHCPRCARHAETLERGLEILRVGDVSPSPRFRGRLNRRLLAEISIGDPVVPTSAGLAAAFLFAAGISLFLFEGLKRPPEQELVAARLAPALDDTLPLPAPDLDVTLPAFTDSKLEFTSSQVPLGTQVVFTP